MERLSSLPLAAVPTVLAEETVSVFGVCTTVAREKLLLEGTPILPGV